jgi:hypothetical protein
LKAPSGKVEEKKEGKPRKGSIAVVGCDGMAQNLQDPLYQALFSENDQSRDEKQKEDD